MSQTNEMSAEEFQQIYGKPARPTQVSAQDYPKQVGSKVVTADTYSAQAFRDHHVDQKEHNLQAGCIRWFRLAYPNLLLFAVPNAARRSPQLASMLEAEGLISGIPDLVLAYPTAEYPGLYIEMKTRRKNSTPSENQIKVQAYLRAVGYMVILPTTFEEFEQQVNEYLYEYQSKKQVLVHQKYGGRCGYCGKLVTLKQMQVDHMMPQAFPSLSATMIEGVRVEGVHELDNLMPACATCNHYKRSATVEGFRQLMSTLHERIRANYITKVALKYGIVEINPFNGIFYFERVNRDKARVDAENKLRETNP